MEATQPTLTREKVYVFAVILASLFHSGVAVAAEEQPGIQEARTTLEACYMKESTLIGLKRCDRPPLLIRVMADACRTEKAALQQIIVSTSSEPAAGDSPANADEIIDQIILELQPKIRATLISAQSRQGC